MESQFPLLFKEGKTNFSWLGWFISLKKNVNQTQTLLIVLPDKRCGGRVSSQAGWVCFIYVTFKKKGTTSSSSWMKPLLLRGGEIRAHGIFCINIFEIVGIFRLRISPPF